MATTTNYGWTTPDDTALVKDGASAIRTLGTSVDTTTKNLNPSTTLGDIEYRSSTANTNTRVGIGSSGQALTVVAGVPSWAASPTSVLTTTGDTLYASAANTLARLGVGSTGQVLTVASGVPSWATPAGGGRTLLSTTTLSGASTTVSSINQTYKDLFIVIYGMTNATADGTLNISPNNANNAATTGVTGDGSTGTTFASSGAANSIGSRIAMTRTNANNVIYLTIQNYTSTTIQCGVILFGKFSATSGNIGSVNLGGGFYTASATSSIVFANSGGNWSTGTVEIYGVN